VLRSIVAAGLVVAGAGGCAKDHQPPPCPRNEPAFRLQLTAPGGVLPSDTRLTVNYSGNREEKYSLSAGGPMNTDVCCRTGAPVGGRLPDVRCTAPSLSSSGPPLRDASYGADATLPPAKGDAGPAGPVALLCDLWTNGYADVQISASGYPDFEHEPFVPNVPDPRCGVVTVDLRIELGHTDAGVSP
jgi:hypothetical protein